MAHAISIPMITAPARATFQFVGFKNLVALAQQRRQLAKLDDHMLADIGVSRKEAATEANKPLWMVSGSQF